MRFARNIIIAAFLAVLACGCTHNNGDIGQWYGQWKLESIEADGVPVAEYEGNMFWAFQNNVLNLDMVQDEGLSHLMRWATWSQDGKTLLIDFRHYDGYSPTTDNDYHPFPILRMEKDAVNTLAIETLTSRRLVLKYDAGDKLYTYRLRKWG